jgi:hypothetical protein
VADAVIFLTAPIRALHYELFRLGTTRSTFAITLLALLGAAALTVPGIRLSGGLSHPTHEVAWVIAGGVPGAFLPSPAAAVAAAWIGALSAGHEYRRRGASLAFRLVPKRGAVLAGKAVAAALLGAFLGSLATVAAYGAVCVGLSLTNSAAAVPAGLMVPSIFEACVCAACGAAGVFTALVFRSRLLTVIAAPAGVASTVAELPRSTSPAAEWFARTLRPLVTALPGADSRALIGAAWVLFALLAFIAVHRRRVG